MKATLRALFATERLQWTAAQLLIMRILFALCMWQAIHWNLAPTAAEVKAPHALARILPLGWLAAKPALSIAQPIVAFSLLLYILGRLPWLALLPVVFVSCATGALRFSMGDIGHSTQLPAMVLLAQWLVYSIHAARTRQALAPSPLAHRDAALWSLIVIAAGYMASAIVKLDATNFTWIARVPYLAGQIVKSNLSNYYSSLEPLSPFFSETIPQFIVAWPNLARLFFGSGLLFEACGFLLLLNRRLTFWFGITLLLMHAGISLIMEIEFWHHMALLLIFCILPGWRRTAVPAPPLSS